MATNATRLAERPGTGADDTEALVSRTEGDAPERLRLLDSDHTSEILVALTAGPRRGRELAAACDASRSTVYRRVNRLEAAGLVTSETAVDPDGHHCKQFRLVRDRLTVSIEDGAITVIARAGDGAD